MEQVAKVCGFQRSGHPRLTGERNTTVRAIRATIGTMILVGLATSASANGIHFFGGRYYSDLHPYHNGYPFVPPSSAYEAVRVRPPAWFGAPAYYYPQSYLAPGYSYYPPASYPGVPVWRMGGYYMSAYGSAAAYPW